MLAKLDLAVPKEVLVDPQPFAVAVLDLQTRLVRHYARQYVNVDRQAFDRWLLSLIPHVVDVRHNTMYRHSVKNGDSLEIRFIQDGEIRTEKVRYLVGADGPFSMVRREFFSERIQPKRYLAVQYRFEAEHVCPKDVVDRCGVDFRKDYVGIFDPDLTDFYAWSIPKDEYLVLGAAIPFGDDVRRKFNLLKSRLENLGLRFEPPIRREAGQLVRPLCCGSMFPGSNRVILIGESAGLISPSSAEGIGAALSSAWHLSDAFDINGFDAKRYHKNLRKLRWSLWLKIAKIPFMFHPMLRKYVMLSGLTTLHK